MFTKTIGKFPSLMTDILPIATAILAINANAIFLEAKAETKITECLLKQYEMIDRVDPANTEGNNYVNNVDQLKENLWYPDEDNWHLNGVSVCLEKGADGTDFDIA